MQPHLEHVTQKLRALSTERVAEVEDFIDFLRERDNDLELVKAAAAVSEPALDAIWNNDADAAYDRL
ncbi:MAG TPA: hypothetical protein VFG55_00215 [Rhodanobacteraceae bacterium]|nr:hypothetical protein [Rhodanobacteraceae bacterium]